jgi:hypothetical protein
VFTIRSPDAAIVYQRVVRINEWWLSEKICTGDPCGYLRQGKIPKRRNYLSDSQSQTIPTSSTISIHLLPSEKREPEVLNHFREGSAEKKLGGEAEDTEGNDDYKKKEDYSTDF